jgi:cobalamin biosynthesis protein CobD/CbiB
MGLVVLVVPLPVRNPAAMVRTGRTVLMVPAQDLDLMTGGMVLAVLMAQDQMARAGQRVARPLRKGHLDHTANQISTTRREISTTRRDSAGRHGLFELRWLSRH